MCPPTSFEHQDLTVTCLRVPTRPDRDELEIEFINPSQNNYTLSVNLDTDWFYRFYSTFRYQVELDHGSFESIVFGSVVDLTGGGEVHVYKLVYDEATNILLSFSRSTNGEPVTLSGLSSWPSRLLMEDWVLASMPFPYDHSSTFTSYYTTFVQDPGPYPGAPGPLPVLGAAAALGFSRKLRSRIKTMRSE